MWWIIHIFFWYYVMKILYCIFDFCRRFIIRVAYTGNISLVSSVVSWQNKVNRMKIYLFSDILKAKIHFYRSMLNFYHFQTIFYTLPSWTQPWTDVHIDYNTALFSETIWFKDWKPNYRASKVLSGFICCITHLSITINCEHLIEFTMYSIQHYVKKFVSDSRQVGGFLQVLRFPPPIKLTATI